MSTRSHRTVAQGDGNAAYAAPGYLLFRQADDVVAQRFDLRKLATQGDAVRVVEKVSLDTASYCPLVHESCSNNVGC